MHHLRKRTCAYQCFAEVLGTFLLVFICIGTAHLTVISGVHAELWQVALVCGFGVAMAIYATTAVSGAHLNPAYTLAMAAYRGFSWRRVVPYMLAQLLGAVLAAVVLYGIFHQQIAGFEATKGVLRGGPGSELSAMVYGEYFPNPALVALRPALAAVTLPLATCAEILGTAALIFVIFAITDKRHSVRPASYLVPLCIGGTVALLICWVAPISQACFNPARDFGPRLVAYCAGWRSIAIPGPHGGFFLVYIVAPMCGALLGGGVYQVILHRVSQPNRLSSLNAEPCD
jgi:glycerol uptake facilitator protein